MDACCQRIYDLERELLDIDRLLLAPEDHDTAPLVARRAELFAALMREEFLLTSYYAPGAPRAPDPRARAVRRLPCAYCIPQTECGLLPKLQSRARYAQSVEELRRDLADLDEERVDATARGDLPELLDVDAYAARKQGDLESNRDMVDFLTREVDAHRRFAARQRRRLGRPIP